MELIAKGSFYRDLIKHSDSKTLNAVYKTLQEIASAQKISQIQELKKLKQYKTHYRIRIANEYRMGIVVRGNTVWIVRFCHRSIFYKRFP